MIEEFRKIETGKRNLQKFGVFVGLILIILAGYFYLRDKESFKILLASGIILLAGGFIKPLLFKPFYWVWMFFAIIMSWIMTRLILTVIFYLILIPTGFILRLFGKKFLQLKINREKVSYWNMRDKLDFDVNNYENQY